MTFTRSILAASLAVLATPALAHTAHPAAGLVAGFAHPFLGADHLLAMVAVGVFAATLRGPALWAVPLSFVASMLAGGALGFTGVALPAAEAGILASVIALGGLIAWGRSWPLAAAMAAAGLFAVFHGYAHGAEIPAGTGMAAYSLGFALATTILHALGLAAGLAVLDNARAMRLAGAAVGLAGVALTLG